MIYMQLTIIIPLIIADIILVHDYISIQALYSKIREGRGVFVCINKVNQQSYINHITLVNAGLVSK